MDTKTARGLNDVQSNEKKVPTAPSSATKAAAKKSECAFLALPAELRNRIYEFALIKDDPIEVVLWRPCSNGAPPALTQTSRQIRSESLPIFYGLNTFRLDAEDWFNRAIAKDTASTLSNIQLIRDMEIIVCDHGNYYRLRLNDTFDDYSLGMVHRQGWSTLEDLPKCLVRPQRHAEAKAVLDLHMGGAGGRSGLDRETFDKLMTIWRR